MCLRAQATFQLPKDIPWDMYDLVLSFETKKGAVQRIAGQAVCVRPPLPKEYHVAGCGHMNTWGQQTAEYLTRVAEVTELAGARTLVIAVPEVSCAIDNAPPAHRMATRRRRVSSPSAEKIGAHSRSAEIGRLREDAPACRFLAQGAHVDV